jgi:hypothetical protein
LTADEQHLGLRAVVGDMKQLPLVPRILSFGKNHIHFVAQFGADIDTLLYDMNAYAEENTRFPLDVEMQFAEGEGI